MYSSDSQCALSHSGVLCGGCPPGLSLAIGSSRCIDCPDNSHVALLLVFMIAGIALVLFIKVLDLTVAHGTINGLIFYANGIWINSGILFSGVNDSANPSIFFFLKGFISWLNLDFAIETCFVNGLNAYWKTWLQFVFPFYIWALAGLIVLICRYSTRVTGWFGNNAVSVLTTLFLLSYVKLLRILVSIFGVIKVQLYNEDSEGSQWVWFLDGNVQYLGLEHAFLFVMALLVLLFLWLPYTAILLAEYRLSKCFNLVRLKSLLDSYIGPLTSVLDRTHTTSSSCPSRHDYCFPVSQP